jgi:hypothetical protein
MSKPTPLAAPAANMTPPQGCPFRWRGHCALEKNPAHSVDTSAEADYIQVRRQGIYLAACIVDDVAGLGLRNPDAVIDEIRRRICELVRYELKAPTAR